MSPEKSIKMSPNINSEMKRIILVISSVIIFSNAFSQGPFEIKPTSVWQIEKLINVISRKDHRAGGDESYTFFVHGDTVIEWMCRKEKQPPPVRLNSLF